MNRGKGKYRQWSRILSMLFLSIAMLQVFSKVIWQHAHIMSDGTVITHTHPYSKADDSTPFKKHHHSNFEILFLQYLGSLTPVLSALIAWVALSSTLKLYFNPGAQVKWFLKCTAPGRSPPAIKA